MKLNVFALAQHKGGTGKTTVTANLAAGLAAQGKKVLIIDSDPQANLTRTFLEDCPNQSLYDTLVDNHPLATVQLRENLYLVPASTRMFGIGNRLVTKYSCGSGKSTGDYRTILARTISLVRDQYDYILIDCPPSDGTLFYNALFAADHILIVAGPEPYSISGVKTFCDIIRSVRSEGHQLYLAGVILNNVETGSKPHSEGEAIIRGAMGQKFVYNTIIRHSRQIQNATINHKDVFSYASKSIAAEDFGKLVNEFLEKTNKYEQH